MASAPAVRLPRHRRNGRGWLKSGEIIEAGPPPRPATSVQCASATALQALSRALKDRNIPVAGADRLSLPGHIAVKDLAALGRFLIQPEDDLSLAAVLRSPIFDVSEEALFALAAGRERGVSLVASLREKARDDTALAAVAEQLEAWANEAAFRPVFEFYAALLARDGVRKKMIARLGPEAGEYWTSSSTSRWRRSAPACRGWAPSCPRWTAPAPRSSARWTRRATRCAS